jgi:hypothetical protein
LHGFGLVSRLWLEAFKRRIASKYFLFLRSVKPFQRRRLLPGRAEVNAPGPAPAWLGRSIATQRLRILEYSALVDQQRDQDTYHKHLFVHIGSSVDYSDPLLEVRLVVFLWEVCCGSGSAWTFTIFGSWIRIRIKLKSWILIRINVMRIRNTLFGYIGTYCL